MSQPPTGLLTLEQLLATRAQRPLNAGELRQLNTLIRDEAELARLASDLETDALLQWHFGQVPQVDLPPPHTELPDAASSVRPAGARAADGRPATRRPLFRRVAIVVSTAMILGVTLATFLLLPHPPGGVPAPDRVIRLSSQWVLRPTGEARYEVVGPLHIRLHRGELLVRSAADGPSPPQPLLLETPSASAAADGTEFFIGAHLPVGSPTLSPLTRVLVLSGVVTLANPAGEVRGEPGDLLAAEENAAPARLAVRANNDFAWRLHEELVRTSPDGNLLFSPYSVATALAMVQEGARGETALEIGNVLGFPEWAHRVGDDAQLIPWHTALLLSGMSQLQSRLNAEESDATRELRARIAALRGELDAANARTVELQRQEEMNAARESQRAARELAREINALLTQVDRYQLATANAIWGDGSYPFDDRYVATINETFRTEGVFSVDFANEHEAAREETNAWVAERTGGMIPQLLEEGAVGPLTRLVLTNGVYFLGAWSEPFREGNTQPQAFLLAGGQRIEVPLMSDLKRGARYGAMNADGSWFDTPERVREDGADADARYPADDGFQLLEVPYKGEELSMVILLPRARDGLPRLHALLHSGLLDDWISRTERRNVRVYLPKFQAEGSYLLQEPLRRLGVERAFAAGPPPLGADFSGMTASSEGQHRLSLDEVIHKCRISVHERGTEAAAATAVALKEEEAAAPPEARPELVPFTPVFRADRPFAYVIRDRESGSILFVGMVQDPGIED